LHVIQETLNIDLELPQL